MPHRNSSKFNAPLRLSAFIAVVLAAMPFPAFPDESAASPRQDVEAVLSSGDFQTTWPQGTPDRPSENTTIEKQREVPDASFEFNFDTGEGSLSFADGLRFAIWILIGIGVIYLLIRYAPSLRIRTGKPSRLEDEDEAAEQASLPPRLSSLEDIERIAREGKLDEAVHLLLLRFIDDIRANSKTRLQPALTSREVLATASFPEPMSKTFTLLVAAVEHSHFGGRPVRREMFEQCLEGYRTCAFPGAGAS